MMDNLPNTIFIFAYIDASWTIGADNTAKLAYRMLKKMEKDGATMIVPRVGVEERSHIKKIPFLDLKTTYVQQAQNVLPSVCDCCVLQRRSYYWRDLAVAYMVIARKAQSGRNERKTLTVLPSTAFLPLFVEVAEMHAYRIHVIR
ncbi:hypothetical protein BDV36DRAFT_242139 [Aspergillus pseudocaelatus]|uniref:Uncharacterized protein n=1 Tax=Aspergillus pseudocaelatus TaxID=1825620 RepID=A0ABQ6X386_9EURO|nr:hypothetical protein BDV36DRAFT_242139 [Aspergillus pseudocaelatus]